MHTISPGAARAMLALAALSTIVLVGVALGLTEPVRRAGPSDLDTYERVVAAIRAGEGYYGALHQALLDGGYGTLSPLNWRTPPFLTFLSWFPSLWAAKLCLAMLSALAWGMAVTLAFRRGGLRLGALAGVVMALALAAIAAPRAELSFELCAGTLILISVSAYGLGWRVVAVAAGALALFVRELAVIYVLVCLALALRRRRWREAALWVVLILAYAGFYVWHASQAMAMLGPLDRPAAAGWLQFGGLGFVLQTASFNGVLLALPHWASALVLVPGLLGLAARAPRSLFTVTPYLLLFMVYGRPENGYWGALYTPLVSLGLVFAPEAIGALVARARAAAPTAASAEQRR